MKERNKIIKYLDNFEDIYPVIFNDKLYYKEDCDELFVMMYEFREQLNYNGGIYLTEGKCLNPDGSYGDF
jgi:hypothetical protein